MLAVATFVTVVGGDWSVFISAAPRWKTDIQIPKNIVVLYLGWVIGPFGILVSPLMVCILTILVNAVIYCAILRTILVVRERLKACH
jgi:hypothetical protein